jgi:hypothetical protein
LRLSQNKKAVAITDSKSPCDLSSTGTCLYGLAPASTVDPHPAISAQIVGWYYPKKLERRINKIRKTNRCLSNVGEHWNIFGKVILKNNKSVFAV